MREVKKFLSKKVVAWLLVLVMVGAYLPAGILTQAAEETSILTNGDFEVTGGWVYAGGAAVPAQTITDETAPYDVLGGIGDFQTASTAWGSGVNVVDPADAENRCLKLSATGAHAQMAKGVSGLDASQTYTVRFRMKTDGAVPWQYYTAGRTSGNACSATTALADWTWYETTFTGTSVTLVFQFIATYTTTGAIYLDDVTVTYPKAVEKTEVISHYAEQGYVNGFEVDGTIGGWSGAPTATAGAGVDGSKAMAVTSSRVYNAGTQEVYTIGTTYTVSFKMRTDDSSVTFYSYAPGRGANGGVQNVTSTWTDYSYSFTAAALKQDLVVQIQGGSGTVYIDDFDVTYTESSVSKVVTEGIGNCNEAEASNVLTMKDKTEVKQLLEMEPNATYNYSFKVKKVNAGADFTFGIKSGSVTKDLTSSVTDAWTTVAGSFTAEDSADGFGFTKLGTGEIRIDDVVLTVISRNPIKNGEFDTATDWLYKDNTAVPAQTITDEMAPYDVLGGIGDFQTASTAWGSGVNVVDPADAENRCLKLSATGAHAQMAKGVSGLDASQTYTVRFRMKTDGAVPWQYYTAGRTSGNACSATTALADWTWYETTFTGTSVTLVFQFIATYTTTGAIYLDDVTVTYPKAVEKTEVISHYAEQGYANGFEVDGTIGGWSGAPTATAGAGVDGSKAMAVTSSRVYNAGTQEVYTIGTTYTVSFKMRTDDSGVTFYSYAPGRGANGGVQNVTSTWTDYSYSFTAAALKQDLVVQIQGGSGTVYIDDFDVTYTKSSVGKTYTEGIGTCNDAESSDVLSIKEKDEVKQLVTLASGDTYAYSFDVKKVEAGSDFAFGIKIGSVTKDLTTKVTDEWTTVEGFFTAPEGADSFAFTKTGAGEVRIDNVALLQNPVTVVDHTPELADDYVPAGVTVLTSGGSFDNNTFNGFTKSGAYAVSDGLLKGTFDGTSNDYVQTAEFDAVKGHEYVISYYIYIENATDLNIDMYSKGLGSPASQDKWTDQLFSKASAYDFSVTLDGKPLTSGLTANTEGWKLVKLEWTAAETGKFFIGAARRYGGTGTVYVDDFVLYDKTKTEDMGTFTIKAGEWVNTSYNDTDGYHTNLSLTEDSLVNITTNEYWWKSVDYSGIAKDYIEFVGVDESKLSKMLLIKGVDRKPLVFQIAWGTSLENVPENAQITLKKGLPIQYRDETIGAICTVTLSDDYTLTFEKNGGSTNGLALGTLKFPTDLLIGDLDGNDTINAYDVKLYKRLLLETLSLSTKIGNVNESADDSINAADLVWMIKHEGDKLALYHEMTETINVANAMANSIQVGYNGSANAAVTGGSNAASNYTIDNDNMSLTHSLTNTGTVTSITNSAGVNYLQNGSMAPFATRSGVTLGESNFETNKTHAARANTTIMGYYYDSTYIRDLNWRWTTDESIWNSAETAQVLWLEKGYHTYSDKMYQTYRLVSNGYSNHADYSAPTAVTGLTNFGFDFKLPLSNINTWEIGTASSVQQNVTYTTATSDIQYIAVDTKNAGVIGLIFAGENRTGSEVTVTNDGTNLVIRQIVTQAKAGNANWTTTSIKAGESVEFGHRLYTDDTHDFAGIRRANHEEQNPLTEANFSVDGVDSSTFEGYNYRKGYYDFTVDGYDFGEAYANPDKKFFANIKAIGGDDDRMAYICVGTSNELEGATIMDTSKVQLPIPMQVNKNFGNENEEPIYAPEGGENYRDFVHGEIFMPLVMEAGKTQEFSILNVMQKWGNYPVKQISSIEYYTSYYHLSTGVMETNCIAPFGAAANKDISYQNNDFYDVAWFLPDFRGISGDNQYGTEAGIQRNSVGTVYAPTADGGQTMHTYTGSDIISAGLTHADLDYTYKSNDGKYDIKMSHIEMPQTDESRTYYTIEFTFNGDVTLDQNFNIIGIGARGANGKGNYTNAAYLAPGGVETAVTPRTSGSQSYTLNEDGSYFTFYNISDTAQENGNGAVIVKDYEIQQAAGTATKLAFLNSSLSTTAWSNINYGALILDGGSHTFKAGDSIKVNVVLLSYGAIDQTHYDNVKNVYADTVVNPLTVTAAKGTVDTAEHFLPTVIAKGNRAEFTLSGGTSANTPSVNYAVKVQGFTSLQKPVVYEKVNGEWQLYDYASFSGYDGYSVQMEDGRLTYSFVVTKNAADRTFKVTMREEAAEYVFGFTGADLHKFTAYQLTVGEVETDGAVTLTTSHADPYVHKYHMDYDAPASQKIQVKAKLSSSVTQLSIFLTGDYVKDGVAGTASQWGDGGANFYMPISSSTGVDAGDGYKIYTFDIGSKGHEWSKITGLRLGFNGTGTMTVKEITGQ